MFFVLTVDYIYYLPLAYLSIQAIRNGRRVAYFLLFGLLLYFLSQLEWIISDLGIIPHQLINYLQIKGFSYILLMTISLAYKINGLRKSLVDFDLNLEKALEESIRKYEDDARANKNKKRITENTHAKIGKVLKYLDEHYAAPISRESLAALVDMSPDHLDRMFKQATGRKIADYVNEKISAPFLRRVPPAPLSHTQLPKAAVHEFHGHCCQSTIDRCVSLSKEARADVIVGVGGEGDRHGERSLVASGDANCHGSDLRGHLCLLCPAMHHLFGRRLCADELVYGEPHRLGARGH